MTRSRLYPEPRTSPAGDRSLLVELGDGIDEAVNRAVHALAASLDQRSLPGVVDLIPTYRSLLINYDPAAIAADALVEVIADIARARDDSALPPARRIDIPTCYGAEFGPDLPFVAQHNHLTPDEVIAIHTSNPCRVFMMGFSPGFAYMGGMSPRIATPRLKTPRTSIPAGSVGIAQEQTGVYPVESPGGWQLIGRTPIPLFDPAATPPTLLQPGDVVRFVAITEAEYRELEKRVWSDVRSPKSEVPSSTSDVGPRPSTGSGRGELVEPGTSDIGRRDVIEVLDPGALTTVQDLGRYGFQRYGVPVSGAMDAFALRVANLLVGNAEGAAGLEMTIAGPQLRLLDEAVVAITGADMQVRVDDWAAPSWQPFTVPRDAVLAFRGLRSGARAYLAIAGGLDVPVVLGSRSTYLRSRFGGYDGRALVPGDHLARGPMAAPLETRSLPASWLPLYLGSHRLRVILGPQHGAFPPRGIETLLGSAYVIGNQSDRMGYRLDGPRIEHRAGADIVSDGSPAGAIQVAGDGLPLVLLADRGTTGGYAKIATVISADLPRLAQCKPGDRVFFDQVSASEAHEALARENAFLDEIRTGPRLVLEEKGAVHHSRPSPAASARAADPATTARAPLPGRIVEVAAATGDTVERGQRLAVLEAMKMQNPICATRAGRVRTVHVHVGDQVTSGQALVEIEPETGSR